jgi:type II secretory pathway component PulF
MNGNDQDHGGQLRGEQAAALLEAVGGAAANRLPIEITLAALAEETNDRRLGKAAQQFATQLEQGATMEQAVAAMGSQISSEVASLLRAGVESGDLAGTIAQLSEQQINAQRLRRKIWGALIYPVIVLAILVPFFLFLSWYLIPSLHDIYEEFDMPLPMMTEFLVEAAKETPKLIAGGLTVVFGLPLLLRLLGKRWLYHRVRSVVPLIGPMWMWGGQQEFVSLLASFLKLRIPLDQALAFTGNSLSDRNVARACQRAARRLSDGQSLGDCLNGSMHFDRSLVALTRWGERYGVLPEALGIAATLFDDRIDQYATLLKRIVPPLTLISVVTVIFFVVIGMFIPIVSLIDSMMR